MIPVLLALAAAALYLLPLIVPKPPPPDEVALPPLPGTPTPAVPDFVSAVRAVDVAVAYLVETEQYGTAQQSAARVLRAAVVEGATPPVPPGVEATREVS